MASGTGNDRSSPFDRMLAESRSQFDALLRRPKPSGSAARSDRPSAAPAPTPTPPLAPAQRSLPASSHASPPRPAEPRPSAGQPATVEPLDVRATDIGRTLASRFGDAWRYEIVDTRRDGADVVVWGRLVVEDRGYDKTRRGRVRIGGGGGMAAVSGSAGGTAFVLQAGGGASSAEEAATEQAAYDEAAAMALSACAPGSLGKLARPAGVPGLVRLAG